MPNNLKKLEVMDYNGNNSENIVTLATEVHTTENTNTMVLGIIKEN